MLCLDNSEWMRNGDFNPTRIKAQRDAANILCTRHLSINPENTVGIMTLAGPRCNIHCTQSRDNPRLHRAISLDNTPIGGKCRFINGMKIARLALKNRPNQKGEARIIVFVSSPIQEPLTAFKKIGRDLKKNSCGISVILMGETGDNKSKMEALVEAAQKEDGQHCDLIIVPPGVTPLEVIRSSPLYGSGYAHGSGTTGNGSSTAAQSGGNSGGEDELQRALRLSLLEAQAAAGGETSTGAQALPETEEEQIRRALELSMGVAAQNTDNNDNANQNDDAGGTTENADATDTTDAEGELDADALLMQQAIAMSTMAADDDDSDDNQVGNDEQEDEDDEAAMLAAAMAASMEDNDDPALPEASGTNEDDGISDPDYVRSLLADIPGASLDDPLIQAALGEYQQIESEKAGKKDSNDKQNDKKQIDLRFTCD